MDYLNKEKFNEYHRNYQKTRYKNDLKYREQVKNWVKKDKLKNFDKLRKQRLEIRNLVFTHYGKICACCGYNLIEFLTIDHINNDGHLHRKTFGSFNYRWIINNNYPDDLQTLCWNCNMGKAKNKGICPHKSNVNM